MALPELLIHPFRARVQDRAHLRSPVHARHQGRGQKVIHQSISCRGVGSAPGVVEREKAEPKAGGHGLAIVEFRMRSPLRVEDVGFVPVC